MVSRHGFLNYCWRLALLWRDVVLGTVTESVHFYVGGIFVDREDNPVRMIDEIPNLLLEGVLLANSGTPLRHLFERANRLV